MTIRSSWRCALCSLVVKVTLALEDQERYIKHVGWQISYMQYLLETPILQLPPGTISTQQQLSNLKDFVLFATLIYSSWWFSCESTVNAPWNDLQLYQNLLKYAAVNPVVSSSAIRAFNRHLWYLSAEMVPLALFSDVVPDEEK